MVERTSRLRLIIDSSDARAAARDLEGFTGAMKGAEDASGDFRDAQGRLRDAQGRYKRETQDSTRSTEGFSRSVKFAATAVTTLISALAIREVLQFADSFQQAQNRIRLVTNSTEELISVQERLQEIAGRTFNTFSGTADLYSRLARSTEDLGVSSERLLRITETVNQAVALSGTSAQAAQAALFQLGQGLGAGALRGEELNSVLEQTPELARAIADGLGVSIGELRKLGAEGAITAERVIEALENQADAVNEAFQTIEPTVGQVSTVIREAFANALVEEFVSELGDAGEAALKLRDVFAALGTVIGRVFAFGIEQAVKFIDLLEDRGLIGGEPIELRFSLDSEEINNETLRKRLLGANETLKIAVELNPQSLSEVEKEFERVSGRIEELRLIQGGSVRSLTIPQLAELGSLETQARNLYEIIRASAEQTGGFRDALKSANDVITGTIDPLDGLADNAKKAADRLKTLSEVGSSRGRFAQGIAGDAPTIQEFDRSIAPFFSDEAARQLADELGISIGDAQRALNQEEARLRQEFLDEQLSISRENAQNVEDAVRQGVEKGFSNIDLQAIGGFAEIGDRFLSGVTSVIEQLRRNEGFDLEGITRAVSDIGQGFGRDLQAFGDTFFGENSALSAVGETVEAVGQIAGFVSSAIGLFKALFGNVSDFTAQGVFNPVTGQIAGVAQDSGADENAQARDALIESISSVTQRIFEITGANLLNNPATPENEAFLNVAVRRTGISVGFQGADGEPTGGDTFDASSRGAEQAFDEAVRLVSSALSGGTQALVDYAKAASEAGRGAEDILTGLEGLKSVFALTEEPLSAIEQQLKNIDDIINPVIADLEALGQSIADIQQVARDAVRALGDAFIRDIEQDILNFRNATLGEFKRILDAQADLISDARALLDRGAITPAEFDLVQVRNALERESFFQGLSAEDLEGLGDFFGLIEDSGGSVAVVLTQLTQAFSDFTDNVAKTRDRLQDEADQLQGFADQIFRTRDQIDLRFPSLSGGELIGDLRGQLNNLREAAFAGDNTAFEQISDVANRLVSVSRDIFGSTSDFAEQRDFALSILDQTGGLAESRANKLLSEIEALNRQVDVLNDIRDVLESPDPAIEFLKAQLDQGEVQNDLIRQLLVQYIALTQEARATQITPAEAQAASEGFLSAGGSSGASVVTIDRFDESIVLLSQIRAELSASRQQTTQLLRTINNEQRRSTTNATLTG